MTSERVIDASVWRKSSVAKRYLEGTRAAIPLATEQIDVMLRAIAACEGSIERVLDLGCGNGVLGAHVLAHFPNAQGIFVDFSPAMIEAARAMLFEYGARARLVEFDYGLPEWVNEVLPWAPYDAIVSGFSIHHQTHERKRGIFSEIFGLLRPGGIFINIEHVASVGTWGEALFNERMIDALHEADRMSGGTKIRDEIADAYLHREDRDANILAQVEQQCAWLRDIGYTDVDCFCKIFELAVFGGRRRSSRDADI